MATHNIIGRWGEEVAARYLVQKGYAIRDRDWKVGKRDLDIVALAPDMHTMVFVEVKTRSNDDIIEPTAAVTPVKMKSIGIAANSYVKAFNIADELRFDIITVVGTADNYELQHIEDAFNPCML